ncbi:MAG: o-succinylbenzoate synthase [Gemmatimonadales bacterium]|nr:o-succinylbenzoate synthase [Gemmatimonadales bacterium]
MIELAAIELREIALPLKEPFRISSGSTHRRRILLARVVDRDGGAGWGECVAGEAPYYSAETVDTAWLAITSWIAPLILAGRFDDPPHVYGVLEAGLRGHRMAKAAIEMATWDLVATRTNVALSTLLGGTRAAVPTGISLGLQDSPKRLAARAAQAVAEGYRRVKIKIARGRDREDLAAAREAVGPDVPLSADANAAYAPLDSDHLRTLDEFGLRMLEQPFEPEDLLRHARLQRTMQTPICLDESITSPARAADMIALRSGQAINIKPGRVGGLTPALMIHDLAAEHGITVWCGGMLESGIGRAHNVALASLAQFEFPGDLSPSARYWARDIVHPEWTMHDGTLAVPRDRAGIGVEIDLDFLASCTVRQETVTASPRTGGGTA